ncbi:TetR/AcrR family transcriptional regulator [Paenibacillus sp. GYB003]|uniref:TetR/AcrR family transcriptional regulator n=1 Tax=Paenibacillus sp. GYB003 TaxID=2994392 RepID=UPI002F961A7A
MTTKTDRRQIKTNRLLRRALFELMEEKQAEAITVTDIANRANVNRGTFYLHYRDVPDMLEKLKDEMLGHFKNTASNIDPRDMIASAAKGEPYPVAVAIFEFAIANADFFKAIFGPNGDMSFVRELKAFMTGQLYNKLVDLQPPDDDLLIPRDYLVAYIASANVGIVMHWIETGMKLPAREMGQVMTQLMNYGPLASAKVKKK